MKAVFRCLVRVKGRLVRLALINVELRLLSVVLIKGCFCGIEVHGESLHGDIAIFCFAIVWSVCLCVRACVGTSVCLCFRRGGPSKNICTGANHNYVLAGALITGSILSLDN